MSEILRSKEATGQTKWIPLAAMIHRVEKRLSLDFSGFFLPLGSDFFEMEDLSDALEQGIEGALKLLPSALEGINESLTSEELLNTTAMQNFIVQMMEIGAEDGLARNNPSAQILSYSREHLNRIFFEACKEVIAQKLEDDPAPSRPTSPAHVFPEPSMPPNPMPIVLVRTPTLSGMDDVPTNPALPQEHLSKSHFSLSARKTLFAAAVFAVLGGAVGTCQSLSEWSATSNNGAKP